MCPLYVVAVNRVPFAIFVGEIVHIPFVKSVLTANTCVVSKGLQATRMQEPHIGIFE